MLIQNSEINSQATTELNNQAVTGGINQLTTLGIPVWPMQPRYANFTASVQGTASGAQTVYTARRGKRFCITHVQISLAKDAASDNVSIFIEAARGGAYNRILQLTFNTLTADRDHAELSLKFPIICDMQPLDGSTISTVRIQKTQTVGTMNWNASVSGYEI